MKTITVKTGFFLIFLMFLSSCQLKKAIEYGKEVCDYCTMIIVDAQHAAMLVTKKGKLYKFDSIECMLHYQFENKKEYSEFLVCDYSKSNKFINGEKAHFLISKDIPSPMGAFLSAFETESKIHSLNIADKTIYTWKAIQKYLEKNRF